MAQPQARPQDSFLRILLIAVFVFMSYQMFCVQNKQTDARTADEVWQAMVEQNQNVLDLQIAKSLPIYTGKLDELQKEGKLTLEDKEERVLEANMLVAATQFQGGLEWDNIAKLDRSYQQLSGFYEKDRLKPIWTEATITARGREAGSTENYTAETLFGTVTEELQERNRHEVVWGIFPGYQIIDALVSATGKNPNYSYVLAALFLAVLVRAAIWPLAQKQYMWGRQMAQLQPYMKEIQDKYKDKKTGAITDQQAMQQEVMALYGKYGLNPMAGCLPMMVQMPLFLAVYQCMWKYKFEFMNGVFLWVNPAVGSIAGIPTAPNLGERDYILIVIYGISMVVTTMLQPTADTGTQSPIKIGKFEFPQAKLMGLVISVVFSVGMFFWPGLPSAFVLYWIFTNILSTIQAIMVYRQPAPELAVVVSDKGGVIPMGGKGGANGKGTLGGKTNPRGDERNVSADFFGATGGPRKKRKKKK